MAGQCKGRGEGAERRWNNWIDRDRPAGPFDRLIVLLQPEISLTFAEIPKCQLLILRTEPYGFVEKFDGPLILSDVKLCKTQKPIRICKVRVQGERAFEFSNRIV